MSSPLSASNTATAGNAEAHDGWHDEMQSAFMYRALEQIEKSATQRDLFAQLAVAAEKQASLWAAKMQAGGHSPPSAFKPTRRALVVLALARRFGTRYLLPALAALKVRGLSTYRSAAAPAADVALLQRKMPTSMADVGTRHRGGQGVASNLRATIFGINDGLVSNASLILGVAGAQVSATAVMVSGFAGLLAGACSMAAGEYLSMRSQKEFYEQQIDLERQELALYPEEEAAELALIYQARGLPHEQARALGAQLVQDPMVALQVLSREELGINPEDLGSPWAAALYSFLAFGAGAVLPLLPFMLGARTSGVGWSMGVTAVALLAVGAATTLFTGKGLWRGALRMLLIGATAGAVTYVLGRWVGAQL